MIECPVLISKLISIMTHKTTSLFLFTVLGIFLSACSSKQNSLCEDMKNYKPVSQELYDSIVNMDSIFFNAYNNCDLETQTAIYSDSIEFYHDQGGLMTSKQAMIDATKKNICGKVTRELVKGSVEVYPIKGYGAVEMGLHKFHNNTEKEGTPSHASKFIVIWQHRNNEWKMTRVISLH
jgi:ketosteroid isomerase-like protein